MFEIRVKRVREPAEAGDGERYLVDRLWPRGLRKDAVKLDQWFKEVAPSTELRRWFHQDREQWDRFRQKYLRELDANPEVWRPLLDASRRSTVTLLYDASDSQRNHAVVLKQYLEQHRTGTAKKSPRKVPPKP